MTRARDADRDDASTFTLRRVQAMLGLSRGIVAGLIAEGFVAPTRGARNEWRFTFQDLMLLRTAHALRASKIPPRRILRSLAKLKATLPSELPLTGLRITAIGADVAVRDRDGRWQTDSGQLLMDFDVAPVAGSVAFLDRDAAPAALDAAAWFERGLALEASDATAAEAAYRQALALAPALVEAYLNLGAMWSEAGRFEELAALSDEAVAQCPGSALIHFNRGVALDHLERAAEAIASYEASLALDPGLADAHYNLGRLREQLGDARGALRHFAAYRRLHR
ncbi:MAG TPA: tetratricopeptide repeat protein [Burkholderiaceae bacterium]|nr:tetratricopeptide repeat protein [Burkholderiaceae bacterium]